MDEQNKNLILATALSFLVIMVWTVFFSPVPDPQLEQTGPGESPAQSTDGRNIAAAPPTEGSVGNAVTSAETGNYDTREQALSRSKRVTIDTGRLKGSLSLVGGRLDDLKFVDYLETLDEGSDPVTLLSPAGGPNAYYTIYGWSSADGDTENVPDARTDWKVETGQILSSGSPIILRWDSPSGLIYRREISIDENYLFNVRQSVENPTDTAKNLAPYGIIARHGEPDTIGFYILHEGVVRSTDGEIGEIDYNDMPDFGVAEGSGVVEKIKVQQDGWIGFTDKYWMTTLIPDPGQPFTAAAKFTAATETYQTDMRLPVMEVPAGGRAEMTTSLFAGAKEWDTIRNYEREKGFNQFVDSIDWGWFFFITKPMFQVLHYLNGLFGNMGWAIIGLTFIIKLILLPLAYKSFVSMAKLKKLQPEMEKIKEKVGDDRQKLQQEMMALYKREKANPAAGCLPILVQIPIFFAIYKVIFVTLELRHAPFIGWITDLSAPDPTSWMNLFGLLPYEIPGFLGLLSIGIWPILMGVTMWLQQKLNPAPTDPTQAMIFAWLPWVFMFMLGGFASGLVIYWVANNTITFVQQYLIMRSQGIDPNVFGNILDGFKKSKPEGEE